MARTTPSYSSRFGIGEWYGSVVSALTLDERVSLASFALNRSSEPRPHCPFKPRQNGTSQPCTKSGGVCSLQLYERHDEGEVVAALGYPGLLRCVCPHRFAEGGQVHQWIGEEILGTTSPLYVGEVPFLRSDSDSNSEDGASVGRIDSVLVHPNRLPLSWCAVEMQAVYFSGPAMSSEFEQMVTDTQLPFPNRIRRPDYRSSGPKRLMPQLQIKVPTLRRWGKKMAVVVDEAFFGALGKMDDVAHVSNADIAWFVVGFDIQGRVAQLSPRMVRFTTLERAVEGLTAGTPLSLTQFEAEIEGRLDRKNHSTR
jgi:hypothetical protein